MLLHEEYHAPYRIQIFQDMDAENPFDQLDYVDIVGWHRRSNFNTSTIFQSMEPRDVITYARQRRDILLPLFMYQHGNYIFSLQDFNDRWDSGQLGYLYIHRKAALRWFFGEQAQVMTRKRLDKIIAILEKELQWYTNYINGEVYMTVITSDTGEELSCFGGYDTIDDALEEARSDLKEMGVSI